VVQFHAEPDSNSSIYVEWNETIVNTNPLLLRYEVMLAGPLEPLPGEGVSVNLSLQASLMSDARSHIITGLRSNAMYRVGVVASSPAGPGQSMELDTYTFPNGEMRPVYVLCLRGCGVV
jgi:hypothetical protein